MNIDNVAILAGGFGKRLGKITKKIPKPLIKVNNVRKRTLEEVRICIEPKNVSFRTFIKLKELNFLSKNKNKKSNKIINKKIYIRSWLKKSCDHSIEEIK